MQGCIIRKLAALLLGVLNYFAAVLPHGVLKLAPRTKALNFGGQNIVVNMQQDVCRAEAWQSSVSVRD